MAVKNFEEITYDLSAKEKALIPLLVRLFYTKTIDKPIKGPEVVKGINGFLKGKAFVEGEAKPYLLTEPRLRKCVGYMRRHSILPLIATNKGYFVSFDPEVIRGERESLRDRSGAIDSAGEGLKPFENGQYLRDGWNVTYYY